MKKIILFILMLPVFFVSCKKEDTSEIHAKVFERSTFISDPITVDVKIPLWDGKYFIRTTTVYIVIRFKGNEKLERFTVDKNFGVIHNSLTDGSYKLNYPKLSIDTGIEKGETTIQKEDSMYFELDEVTFTSTVDDFK